MLSTAEPESNLTPISLSDVEIALISSTEDFKQAVRLETWDLLLYQVQNQKLDVSKDVSKFDLDGLTLAANISVLRRLEEHGTLLESPLQGR